MTIKQEIEEVNESIEQLTEGFNELIEQFKILRGFMVESQVQIAKNMMDLHDRLNYVKEYMGLETFIKTLDGEDDKIPSRKSYSIKDRDI